MLTFGMKSYWVYILASRPRGTLYAGMTNDLVRRAYEHREGLVEGFSRQYGLKMLVYYEQHATALAAIRVGDLHRFFDCFDALPVVGGRGIFVGWEMRQGELVGDAKFAVAGAADLGDPNEAESF